MREIDFDYIRWWKLQGHFKELFKKPVCISWMLDSSFMTEDEMEEYNLFDGDKWDKMYTKLVDIYAPDKKPRIYIWSSLKLLLEKNWYINYEGPIKIYWMFWTRPTTKTHIAEIWKADLLDEEGKIICTFEK